MIRLRSDHHAAFRKAALMRLESRVLKSLIEEFPDHADRLSGDLGHAFFREAAAHAAEYAMTSEQCIFLFAAIWLHLGSKIETDPQWDWVGVMLRDETFSPSERAEIAVEHVFMDLKKANR